MQADPRTESIWQLIFGDDRTWRTRGSALSELGPVVLYAVAVGALTLLMPIAVQTLVNSVAFGTLVQPLVVLSLLVLGALGMSSVFSALSTWTVEVLERRFFLRWYLDVSSRMSRLSRPRENREELVNRLFEVYAAQKSIRSILVGGLEAVLTIAVGLFVLSLYHPILAAFSFVLMLALWAVLWLLGRRGVKLARVESQSKYELVGWLEELGISHRTVASGGRLVRAADARAKAYLQARSEHFALVFRQRVALWALQAVSMAALLAAGGWLVMRGQLTLGQLVAAELIVSGIGLAIAKLGVYVDTAYDLAASAAKLSHLRHGLETVDPVDSGARIGVSPWAVRIEDSTDTATAAAGGVLVIDGDEHAQGELLEQLLLECPPHDRVISFADVSVRDLNHESARRQICFVGREDVVSGTVFDNACAASKHWVDRDTVRKTLESFGYHGDLDQRLDRSGVPLTSSELARVGLARAALSDASLVVLDRTLDVFSIDEATALLQKLTGPTRIVLTRRRELSSIFADRMTVGPNVARPESV